jgi:ribokinase
MIPRVTESMTAPRIVVVGSINMDLVARMPRLPRPGETLSGDTFQTIPGGKGANQAVAAARLGASVTLIGRVGDDAFGQVLLNSLREYGVGTDHVLTTPHCSSGVALIGVESSGANSIVVVAGANGQLMPADVLAREQVIAAADVLIVQLETPVETVATAIRLARQHRVRTILDPAPAPAGSLPADLYRADVISPNQTEAEAMTGIVVHDVATATLAAQSLQRLGASEVVMKLGHLGSLVCNSRGSTEHVPAARAEIIDTTAAGDAFTAGLAVGLAEGKSLSEAARLGGAAGTLACTVFGAQPAMPSRTRVDQFLSAG